MQDAGTSVSESECIARRRPALIYFLLAFGISWAGALVVAAPALVREHQPTNLMGMLMFPAMLLGPIISGIVLTVMVDGRAGFEDLLRRIIAVRVAVGWYTMLLVPPALVLGLLLVLEKCISPVFAPNHFYLGIAFGVPAGICEEIGWMGFAFPKMRARLSPLLAAMILGFLWGLWHLPAIDFLGASVPHGKYWLRFFLAFTIVMTAMRVIIAWLYVNTGSVLLAQLMHVSSTGALVVLSPRVGPGEEVLWYFGYGCLLCLLVAIIVSLTGWQLQVSERQNAPAGNSG
jgi:membrane protease YdiL (CAAX protease family)